MISFISAVKELNQAFDSTPDFLYKNLVQNHLMIFEQFYNAFFNRLVRKSIDKYYA